MDSQIEELYRYMFTKEIGWLIRFLNDYRGLMFADKHFSGELRDKCNELITSGRLNQNIKQELEYCEHAMYNDPLVRSFFSDKYLAKRGPPKWSDRFIRHDYKDESDET